MDSSSSAITNPSPTKKAKKPSNVSTLPTLSTLSTIVEDSETDSDPLPAKEHAIAVQTLTLFGPDPLPNLKLCHCGNELFGDSDWHDPVHPGRRFIQCKNFGKPGGCDYKEYTDPEVHWRYASVIRTLFKGQKKLRLEIQNLRDKIRGIEHRALWKQGKEIKRKMNEEARVMMMNNAPPPPPPAANN